MADRTLRGQLRRVRHRLLVIGSAAAVAWGVSAAVILLLTAAWMDLLWELSPQWRLGAVCVAALIGCGCVIALVVRARLAGRDNTVARRLDAVVLGLDKRGVQQCGAVDTRKKIEVRITLERKPVTVPFLLADL